MTSKLGDRIAIGLLGLGALAFAAFGIQWLIQPRVMAEPLGIALANADATSDARAVYGGLEIGIGVFLAYCALATNRRSIGLVAAMLALFGLGLARLAGILVAPEPVGGGTYQLLAMDLGGAVLFTAGAIVHRRRPA